MEGGVAFINALLACLELLQNFHDENLVAFHLIFVAKIWQHFVSGASWHTKHYPYQAFAVRIHYMIADLSFTLKKEGKQNRSLPSQVREIRGHHSHLARTHL